VAAACAQAQGLGSQRIGQGDLGSHGLFVQRGVGQQALIRGYDRNGMMQFLLVGHLFKTHNLDIAAAKL